MGIGLGDVLNGIGPGEPGSSGSMVCGMRYVAGKCVTQCVVRKIVLLVSEKEVDVDVVGEGGKRKGMN
jgi:hypothetical protein